jgi:hypothetical protein
MRKATFILVLVAAHLAAGTAPADFLKQVQQWSEWGEYPRILETVPSFLDTGSHSLTKGEAAQLQSRLGVALCATGSVEEARNHFVLAYELDPSIALNSAYVSKEILALFQSAVETQKRNDDEKTTRDSIARAQAIEKQAAAKLDSLKLQKKARTKKRSGVLAAAGLFALSAVLAGAAAYEYSRTEEIYQAFLKTANSGEGDLRMYERQKNEIAAGDGLTVASGGCSAVSLGASLFLFVHALHHRDQIGVARAVRGDSTAVVVVADSGDTLISYTSKVVP